MPYITQADREVIDEVVTSASRTTNNAGELNYVLTRIALGYVERHGTRYATFNEVIGALECAKLELYRRMVAPYEDTKIAENGDVYPNAVAQK